MAKIATGTKVRLQEEVASALRFPPPSLDLIVVVHPAALKAPLDRHTQVASLQQGEVSWLGALGEELLTPVEAPADRGARAACASRLLMGDRLWEVVRPGLLVQPGVPRPLSTVYDGGPGRPWIVVGETADALPIAAPLNDATNPKWWTPVLARADLSFEGNRKGAQVELGHLWTLPSSVTTVGTVQSRGIDLLAVAVHDYFASARIS